MYSPIIEANEKDFSEPSTSPLQWKGKKYPSYIINFGEIQNNQENPYMISFDLPASKDDEVSIIMQSVINGLKDYIQKETKTIEAIHNTINDETTNYKGVVVKYLINKSVFNIVCIEDKIKDDKGNITINRNIDSNTYITHSTVDTCVRIIKEALRNAYSNTELERGLRNVYGSNYENTPSSEREYKYDKENTQIDWNAVWKTVTSQIYANETQAQLVKQTGGENIRQNVQIRLRAAA
jgi:hypothetical protein